MSILNVDKIQPIGGGSTITVDATDIQATSATITASSFVGGLPITNGADNRVITASSASAIQGEANLTFDGNTLALDSNTGTINVSRNSRTLTLEGNYGNEGHPAIKTSSGHDLRIFTSGNNERLRIASNGTIGINSTSPGALLDLSSSQPGILFSETGVSANNGKWLNQANASELYWQAQTDAHAGGGNLFKMTRSAQQIQSFEGQQSGVTWFTIRNSDKTVGIGTDNPAERLVVQGNGISNLAYDHDGGGFTSNSGGALVLTGYYDYSGAKLGLMVDNAGQGRIMTKTNQSLLIGTNNSKVITINGSGSVGIRTDILGQIFTVKGATDIMHYPNSTIQNDRIQIGFNAPEGYIKAKNSSGSPASNLAFYTTDTSGNTNKTLHLSYNRVVFVGSSQVQQGSTSKLEVMGTLNNSYPGYSYPIMVSDDAAYNSSAGPGGGIGFSFKQNSGGAYAQAGGIRGIKENTTDGNYASALTFYTRPNGSGTTERLRISSDGYITAPNNVAFSARGGPADLTNDVIIFATQVFQRGGTNYSTSTGIFTAPVAGIYHFMCNPYRYTDSNDSALLLETSTNGGSSWSTQIEIRNMNNYLSDSGRGWFTLSLSQLIDLNKDDQVRVKAVSRIHCNGVYSRFSGFLVA